MRQNQSISVSDIILLPRQRPKRPPMLLIRLILRTKIWKYLDNFMEHLQWVLPLLANLDAVGFFDEYVKQGNVLLHVLENLLLKRIQPGLIPNHHKFICIK